MRKSAWSVCASLLACWALGPLAQAQTRTVQVWTVAGVPREALIVSPRSPETGLVPVVLVFHGHGGTMRAMARRDFAKQWPEAMFVFPQGLPTVTPLDREGTRAGWQHRLGEDQDRDLRFVDAILQTLRDQHRADPGRIFATGHSNGGVMTYLLGRTRGRVFAAIAPSGAPARQLDAQDAPPIPVLHLLGENDPIVPRALQERTLETVKTWNGCSGAGRPWARSGTLVGTLFPSENNSPLVVVRHPGGHEFPEEAPELILKFFREMASRPRP